jgi:1,4-alpha-glucan branching enzyme
MPIYEHPLDASWGYQGTGYYAVTSRYGVPKDLMYFVDQCHQNNIKVILDWVPGHMCKDAHGLYMFDGEPLYEYRDPFIRENIVWGTANFDLSRGEVRSFFISNALFFMKEFHIDGFRLDAVSNMLYYLGNPEFGENKGAQDFLKMLAQAVFEENDAALLAAEDSSAHPKITHPIEHGGMGFNYKWNMGWMNDTLEYFEKDPIYRKYHHHELIFSMHYAYAENYILPLSHDEVVHGKKSLIEKMPGDYWQKFANLRAYMGYFYTHPGKNLLFMGGEFAQFNEWSEEKELDWHLLSFPMHQAYQTFQEDFKHLVLSEKALYEADHLSQGFEWIDQYNAHQSILVYARFSKDHKEMIVVLLNLTPEVYHDYRIGVPYQGTYKEILNSDRAKYGGSNLYNGTPLKSEEINAHGKNQSIRLTVSPLSISLLKWSA